MLSHALCYVSNNKLCTSFYSFLTPGNILAFKQGQEPGPLCFQSLAPGGLVARTLGFHPGYPGLIPRQGAEMSLQDCSLLSLSKIIIVYVADFYFSHLIGFGYAKIFLFL